MRSSRGLGAVVARSARRCSRRAARSPPGAPPGARLTPSSMSWTNSRNRSSSSTGKPSMRAMTLTGMCWAYCCGGVDDGLAGRRSSPMSSRRCRHSLRISGSHGSICLRRERRQQQAAGEGVERRVAGDRRGAADRRLGVDRRRADDDGPAGEVVGVVGDLADELGGDRRPHAAVAVGVGDRAAAPRAARPRSPAPAGCTTGRRGRCRSPSRSTGP